IESGNRTQTLFLILKPEIPASPGPSATVADPKPVPAPIRAAANNLFWIPAGVDASVPKVRPGVSCSMPRVLEGTGERMKQLVANLQKFSATEHLEHYAIALTGKRLSPQPRTFDYVAVVTLNPGGLFSIDEYRNGDVD